MYAAVASAQVMNFPSNRLTFIIAILVILAGAAPSRSQAPPDSISFQGFVTDSIGVPIDRPSVTVITKLYKRGTEVYSQAHPGTEIKNGVFNLAIGAFDTLAFDTPIYLGITIGTNAEISPRTPLQAVPYAFSLRQLRVTPETAAEGPNLIGGYTGNVYTAGVVGATICGGGDPDFRAAPAPNTVSADYTTICGGFDNTAGGLTATVAGGSGNSATGGDATIGGGKATGQASFSLPWVVAAATRRVVWGRRFRAENSTLLPVITALLRGALQRLFTPIALFGTVTMDATTRFQQPENKTSSSTRPGGLESERMTRNHPYISKRRTLVLIFRKSDS